MLLLYFQKIGKLSASYQKMGLESTPDGHLNTINPTDDSREVPVIKGEKGNF